MKRLRRYSVNCFLVLGVFFQSGLVAKLQADDIVLPMNAENFGRSWERLDGPAGRIISAVVQIANNQLNYQIHTPSLSFKAFINGRYVCVSPDAKAYYADSYDFIESDPFRETKWLAVYDRRAEPIKGQDDLKGKKVGLLYRPTALHGVVPQEGVIYDVYSDLATNLRKLERGRLDAVVVPELGLQLYLKNRDMLEHLIFDEEQPLATVQDRVLCHNTPRGREVIQIVNKALRELKVPSEKP